MLDKSGYSNGHHLVLAHSGSVFRNYESLKRQPTHRANPSQL